ncbi:MAG: ComEC/Rec2 family competence protein [Brevinematales bacterium]|nr:ComEC/Rec2 family competence protein [Brevinematales bacterium]
MAAACLVFVAACLWGVYGSGQEWLVFLVLYGSLLIFFRRWVVLVCLLGGLVWGIAKASHGEDFTDGYTERTIQVTSHPLLTPEGEYQHRAGFLMFTSSTPWLLGDTLEVRGKIRMKGKTAFLSPFAVSYKKGIWFGALLSRVYLFWQERVWQHIPASSFRAMVFGLVLGNRLHLDYTTQREFQLSGLFHLLAISGLHLMILWGACQVVCGFFLSQRVAAFLSCGIVSLYTLVLGGPPPMLRASLFLWGYVLLWDMRDQVFWLDWVCFVAALCCAFLPLSWLGVGFFLSFLAVGGILLVGMPLSLVFQRLRPFHTLLGTTFAANMMTLPLLAATFGEISLCSPLANLFVVPFFPFFLGACVVAGAWALVGCVPAWFVAFFEGVWQIFGGLIHLFSLGGVLSFSLPSSLVGWGYTIGGWGLLWRFLALSRDEGYERTQKADP